MTKNDFVTMRTQWLQQANADLNEKIINFMEHEQLNEAQLADVLALNVTDVRNMLNNTGELSLKAFASLLIATGHIIEIKPVTASMMRGMGHHAPHPQPNHNTNRPSVSKPAMPKRDAHGRFVPKGNPMPMGGGRIPSGMPMGGPVPYPSPSEMSHMFGGMPMPQQFAQPQQQTSAPTDAPVGINLDSLNREQLVDEILKNHWDSEIDLIRATRPQIIAFLESKQQPQQQSVVETEQPQNGNVSAFAEMIANELKNNPQLLQKLAQSFGH